MSRQYSQDEQDRMDKRAEDAAKKEWQNDLNRTDPKHTQDRVDAAIHQLRVQMGLEKS